MIVRILYWNNIFICLLGYSLTFSVSAESGLTFDASAKPASLVLGGVDCLKSKSPGFKLSVNRNGKVRDVSLSKLTVSGNKIKVSHPDGIPNFTFRIDTYPNHLAIHLLEAKGIGTGHDYSLSLTLNSPRVATHTLNDLVTVGKSSRRSKDLVLRWPYLWARPRPNGTHGSVVLYNDRLGDSARDAVLAEIWSTQSLAGHMVRPAGQKSWKPDDVMAWVNRWVKKFSTINKVSVGAKTPEELYEMTRTYVIPSGANRVYIFSRDWKDRGKSLVAPHPELFPNGKADLLAYSDFLAKRGIHLQLKSLSPQIGKTHAKYISSDHVDKRIMRWVSGDLLEDVDADDSTIRVRLMKRYLEKDFEAFMRLGNELIHARKIVKGEGDIWTLKNCTRGYGASSPKSHKAGTEVDGCVEINGSFNFADDFGMSNSIAEEVCGEYGDFLNEVNVGHLHFDGTGRMGQYPWFVRDFTDYVYSRVNQPTTGSKVGGNLPAHFEHQFSAAKAIRGATGYRDIRIGPRLHQKGRKHTEFAVSMLDLHFDVMDGVRLGSRRPSFLGGQSGASLSPDTLKHYGMTDHAFQLFRYWVELAPVFDDADADYVAGFMEKNGNHYCGEDVLVLSKNDDGDYVYTPHRVMGRSSGKDEPFTIDQEWGAVPRFQSIRAGEGMELVNPYEAQQPQVVIHVLENSQAYLDPVIKVNGGQLAVKGKVQANEYMKYEGGATAKVYDKNWNLLRSLPARSNGFTVKKGNNTVTTTSAVGSSKSKLRVQYITLGPVYELKTNKYLNNPAGKSPK